MEYRLIRKNRKSVSIKIDPADLSVVVSAPLWLSKREIDAIVRNHVRWIERQTAIVQARRRVEESITPEDIARWKARAKAELPPKIAHYAAIMGVKPTGFRVTSAKKRFGSCSGKNSLSFSYRLMAYPEEAIDYVVVHELAHIKQHNHSRAFYEVVASVFPDYEKRERLLRQPLPVVIADD